MLHYGAEDKSFDPIVVSGPNGSLPHGVPSEKPIQAGEFVTMDIGCKFSGYCSDMTRTVAVGSVTSEMRTVYETVLKAQQAGIAAARGGMTGHDVDAAARNVIEAAGYGPYFGHSFGQRGRGDPRKSQRHPLQRPAPAGGHRGQRGAGHLPAGEAGRAY